jgi:hypothetical protein
VRDNVSRIAGWVLLVCVFVLLLFSPPGFSIIHFYAFLFCAAYGFLLATGMIGTDPSAIRIRRKMRDVPPLRTGSLCNVSEQSFPYAASPYHRKLGAIICFILGLGLTALGVLLALFFHLKASEGILAGIPPFCCGILLIWISIRYPTRYIQVTSQGITLIGYFRTIAMPWQSVLVLSARKHFILIPSGGFVATGILYSLYSDRRKLSFSSQIPGSERLTSLVAEATGLTWNPK